MIVSKKVKSNFFVRKNFFAKILTFDKNKEFPFKWSEILLKVSSNKSRNECTV